MQTACQRFFAGAHHMPKKLRKRDWFTGFRSDDEVGLRGWAARHGIRGCEEEAKRRLPKQKFEGCIGA